GSDEKHASHKDGPQTPAPWSAHNPSARAWKIGPGRYHRPDPGGHSTSVERASASTGSHQLATHSFTMPRGTAPGTGFGRPASWAATFGCSRADSLIRCHRGTPSASSASTSSWYAWLVVLVGLKIASQAQPWSGSAIVRAVTQCRASTSFASSKMNSIR